MKMVSDRTIRSYLRQSIILAKRIEAFVASKAGRKKSTLIGYGFLVRNRRLAQAISQLNSRYAYEKRILIRSMIEIHINYAWIRLRKREYRANRFIKFAPIEQLRILENLELSDFMTPSEYRTKLKEFRSRRAKVRHLFWNPITQGKKQGKSKWAKTWASVTSLESRLREVLKAETGKYDPFLYTLYRWFSSAVHGGPTSLDDVLEPSGSLREKTQPESNPALHLVGAFVVLMATIEALAKETDVIENLEPEMSKLQSRLDRLEI